MKCKIVIDTSEWLDLRLQYVTASEAASILGLNPYMSAMKMWDLKSEPGFTGNAYTKVGQMLEPVVVNIANSVLNESFYLYEDKFKGKVFFYDEDARLGATPDAVNKDRSYLLECKTTNPFSFLRYKNNPPIQYLLQLLIQLHCTNTDNGYLAILSTDLTQKSDALVWPIAIFKVKKSKRLLELFFQELERFFCAVGENKRFRANPQVKTKAKLLLNLSYVEVPHGRV